jgi:hypothetical protein
LAGFTISGVVIRHLPVIAAALPDDHGVRHAIAFVIDTLAVMETTLVGCGTAPHAGPDQSIAANSSAKAFIRRS